MTVILDILVCEIDIDDCLGVGGSGPCNGNGRCIINYFICMQVLFWFYGPCEVDMHTVMMNISDYAAVTG